MQPSTLHHFRQTSICLASAAAGLLALGGASNASQDLSTATGAHSTASAGGRLKNFRLFVLLRLSAHALLMAVSVGGAAADGMNENNGWQFGSAQDKVNKSTVLDQVMKKQGGFYDALRPNYYTNNTTYIQRQYNCSVTASTSGNTGTNATTATTSSPTVSNAGSTSASTAANSATNGLTPNGPNGMLMSGRGSATAGSIGNDQANSGSLGSSVNGSNTSATTGTVTAGVGTSDQVLNSQQSNSGMLTASIAGSSACVSP